MSTQIVFTNVLITLCYILPGYLLIKAKKGDAKHLSTLSSILVYICAPCMVVSSFLSLDFSDSVLWDMLIYFVLSLALQGSFMGGLYFLLKKRYADSKYRILTIGSVLGNVGFFGLPIVRALFPENPEVMCFSSIHMVTMNILVFTIGVYCLTLKKEYMSLKPAILNPTNYGFFTAILLFACGARHMLPAQLTNGLNLIGSMTTPLCMIILGMRLATVSIKKLFSRPAIYLVCLGKLVLFPMFAYLTVGFLPVSEPVRVSLLILSSVPCASVLLNMAEIHKSETELSANCVLLTTLLCIFTIPVFTLLI